MNTSEINVPQQNIQKWQRIVDLLAEIMQVPSALVMKVEPPEITVFVSSHSQGNPYEQNERACLNSGFYCETVMNTRQPLLVPNALEDGAWKSNPDVKLGMISYLGFPICWPNRDIFGTLCVLDNKENAYNEMYQKLLLEFRDVIEADLERLFTLDSRLTEVTEARLMESERSRSTLLSILEDSKLMEQELRRNAAEFQRVLTSVSDHLWSAEFDIQGNWTYHYFSPVVEKITGRPPEFFMEGPERWASTIHPEDKPRLLQAFERMQTGMSVHEEEEYRILLPDGMVRWIRDSATVTPLEQGRFRIDGVVSDITERKKADAVQSALYRIAEKTSSVQDMQEFYSAIHEIVGELMYARNFYIALYDPATEIISFPYFVDVVDTVPKPQKTGKGLTGYVIRTGEPLLAPPEKFQQLLEEGLIEAIGAPSIDWLGVPLRSGRETFGVLAVQSYTEKVRFREKEKNLLTFVSQHIATALERKRSGQVLRDSENRYRTLFEESKDVVYVSTPDGEFLDVNQAGVELFGYSSKEELLQVNIPHDLYFNPKGYETFQRVMKEQGYVKDFELELKKKDGEKLIILETSTAVRDQEGAFVMYRGIMRDITRVKDLLQQLLQSQKMETVGQLAGGVAHDFNNILMAITSYCELLGMKLTPEDTSQHYVEEALKAAERGASLTRRLLAFSRKQVLIPKVIDLNKTLADMHNMLKRLIGEDVILILRTEPQLGFAKADPSQIEQIIMNLSVNARDAMPQGGQMIIETLNTEMDRVFVREHLGARQGKYVMLRMIDTGCGMDEETVSHVFEPFFSTKAREQDWDYPLFMES